MALMDLILKLEGKSNLERRETLIEQLKALKYDFILEKYGTIKKGVNIILEHGKGEKDILITAHYDVAPGSPGANDNASSISVLLDVYKCLQSYKPNNKIKAVIFDQEEPLKSIKGCLGSREYVRKHGLEDVLAVYNLELCGIGNMVGIWPVTREVEHSPALKNLRETLKELKIYFEEAGYLPGFYGDHRSFREQGFTDAFCLSVLPKKDKEEIRKFVESNPLKLLALYKLGKIPEFFRHYHTPEDRSKYLSEESLRMMSSVLYHSIINLDKKYS